MNMLELQEVFANEIKKQGYPLLAKEAGIGERDNNNPTMFILRAVITSYIEATFMKGSYQIPCTKLTVMEMARALIDQVDKLSGANELKKKLRDIEDIVSAGRSFMAYTTDHGGWYRDLLKIVFDKEI